ncbi:hypothetical protein BOO69_17370 [Sulfitobacter alexandrii]|uniref:Flagellar biosynthesis protein FlgN n=1 Tax=Sulfitobacter alexandrii TaxID=1917485 RepID=A0A1J0WL15_9RHOB|nr:hypothetical protein [Sulfitobacter alexandrii]APE44979.1 hypothetical protein BOO69_17370 [Sulfitobacter alexandrii]
MTHPGATERIEALDHLLDEEREALLTGNLGRLADLLDPKEALIEEINAIPPGNAGRLRHLDVKVRRNQHLLDGALDGIRSVAARMAELRQVRDGLETYGADGRKRTIEIQDGPSVERRA